MDGWKVWKGKKIFIILKNHRQYQGEVIDVDTKSPPLVFISIIDKFGNRITFAQSEVDVMQEEKK